MKNNSVILECPRCHKKWGKLCFEFEEPVMPEDITILEGEKPMKEGDPLACSLCNYSYTTWDLTLAIAAQLPKENNATNEKVSVQESGQAKEQLRDNVHPVDAGDVPTEERSV